MDIFGNSPEEGLGNGGTINGDLDVNGSVDIDNGDLDMNGNDILNAGVINYQSLNPPISGGGDLSGPPGATDKAIVRFDGVSGKLVQDSDLTISDSVLQGFSRLESGNNEYLLTDTNTIPLGNNIVAIGQSALNSYNSGLGSVTALGFSSGSTYNGGSGTTFLGELSGLNYVSGGLCTFVGSRSGTVDGSLYDNATSLGYSALCDSSDQVILGDASVTHIANTGDGTCDLGSVTHRFRDLHMLGTATIDGNLINNTGSFQHNGSSVQFQGSGSIQIQNASSCNITPTGPLLLKGFATNGDLTMNNNSIKLLADPINLSDGANKNYVNQSVYTVPWYKNAGYPFKVSASPPSSKNWTDMAWSPTLKLFCMVGSSGGNTVALSADGINWSENTGLDNTRNWFSVLWGKDRFLATSNGTPATMAWSLDGVAWTPVAGLIEPSDLRGMGYSPSLDRYIVCGNKTAGGAQFLYSDDDCVTWTLGTGFPSGNSASGRITWSEKLGLFAGGSVNSNVGQVFTSPDGVSWAITVTVGAVGYWADIVWSPEREIYVIVGQDANFSSIGYSYDGLNWVYSQYPLIQNAPKVIWCSGLGLFMIARDTNASDQIYISPDGVNWSIIPTASTTDRMGVAAYSSELNIACFSANGTEIQITGFRDAVINDVTFTGGVIAQVNGYPQDLTDPGTAWAFYEDSVTPTTPIVVSQGSTVTLANNGLGSTTNTSQEPLTGHTFYDTGTNKFQPEFAGDSYTVGVRIEAESNNQTGAFDLSLDFNGFTLPLGTATFPKGSGVISNFDKTTSIFTLTTAVANGGLVKLTSIVGTTTVRSIGFLFNRTHRAFN